MASVIDELSDFLDSENVKVTLNSSNIVKDLRNDVYYRSVIILLAISEMGTGDSYRVDKYILRIAQFIALNPSDSRLLIDFQESKSSKESYFLRLKETLPEGFRLDNVFDQVFQYLYVSQLITYKTDDIIELTCKGKEYTDLLIEKIGTDKFVNELSVLRLMKRIKLKKGLVV